MPALEIANKLRKIDHRAEPLPKSRVPFVVVAGAPGATLISLVRRPNEFLAVSLAVGCWQKEVLLINYFLEILGFVLMFRENRMPRFSSILSTTSRNKSSRRYDSML